MFDQLVEFAEALRLAGVPVSMIEVIDAGQAISCVAMADREVFKAVLLSTMIKNVSHREIFDLLFEVFFAKESRRSDNSESEINTDSYQTDDDLEGANRLSSEVRTAEMRSELLDAMVADDQIRMAQLAAQSVALLAGIEKGRAVSGLYYIYRTLKLLDVELIFDLLFERMLTTTNDDPIGLVIAHSKVDSLNGTFRSMIEAEVRRLLVADRGAAAVAKTLRPRLLEDIDFMQASQKEISKMQKAISPLAKKLAARVSQRRKKGNVGQLDFRRTFRESLGYGGVPIQLRYRSPMLSRPEIFVLADISGSVSSFSRFALQLVYALSGQFSKVRSYVFIDALDEVTAIFDSSKSIEDALAMLGASAKVVHVDGRTDYGHALQQFLTTNASALTPKSTILILGDARNNYHRSNSEVLGLMQERVRSIYWLNPEPSSYWNSGDSIMAEYGKFCNAIIECRNLRQLKAFIDLVL